MLHQKITFTPRTQIGSVVRKIRKKGLLPAIVYGNKVKNLSISVNYLEFVKLYKQTGSTAVIDVVSEVDSKLKFSCLVHDLDIDPVKGNIRHIDFLAVDLKKKTTTQVPLNFIGEPSKESDGILVKNISEVEVEALPENIPHVVEVDLSILKATGDSIVVADLKTTDKFSIISDPEMSVASLVKMEEEVKEVTLPVETETINSSAEVKK